MDVLLAGISPPKEKREMRTLSRCVKEFWKASHMTEGSPLGHGILTKTISKQLQIFGTLPDN
jgi:hypothetical protein